MDDKRIAELRAAQSKMSTASTVEEHDKWAIYAALALPEALDEISRLRVLLARLIAIDDYALLVGVLVDVRKELEETDG